VKVPARFLHASVFGLLPWLSACVFSVGGSSCSWGSIQGSGVEATQHRDVPEFTRVQIDGSADLVAHAGAERALSLRGDDNLLQFVTTEVRDGVLYIGMQPGSYSFYRDLVVDLSAPALEGLEIHGSSDAELTGLSGQDFAVWVQGSGDVRASGQVERLKASVSGSGDLALEGLHAERADVSISGSGDVAVDVARELNVEITGSGDVRYRGTPATRAHISGSGSVSGT
jgi:Putative auto-transporter adhesin, head GIN domain